MKSFTQSNTILLFVFFSFIFFSTNIQSQNRKFVGKKLLKDGNKTAFKTIPEINKSQIHNSNVFQSTKHKSNSPQYVMGGNVIWSYQDASAIANFTKLNSDGSVPVVGWGLNNMRVSRYTDVNNSPLWEYSTAPNDPGVDISQGFIVVSRGSEFDILDTSNTLLYQFPLPDSLYAAYASISRDASKAIFLAKALGNSSTGTIYSVDLTGPTPTINWTLNVSYSVIGNWTGAKFSASGNKIVVNGRYHIYVLNPSDGSIIWDHSLDNSEAPAVISGDGKIIATADNNGFVQARIFNSATNGYDVLWNYRVPAGIYTNWASSVGISADGSIILAGTLLFNNGGTYDGSIIAFNTYGDGTPKWVYNGAGDMVDDISISDDGRVAAAASWGPLDNSGPDLFVFDVATGNVSYQINSAGSFFAVDLSPDGKRVFTGGKAVHARDFGSGGLVYLANIDLGGGSISGTVNLNGVSNNSGVTVKAMGSVRSAITDSSGYYIIQNIPAGTYNLTATKPGYNFGNVSNIVVTDGNNTSGVNFNLDAFGSQTPSLIASNDSNGDIELSWTTFLKNQTAEISKAVGDNNYNSNTTITKSAKGNLVISKPGKIEQQSLITSNPLLADSIGIYRSSISGGPYNKVASVDASLLNYIDTSANPLTNYYYVATLFNGTGETSFSNEVLGMINDSLLTYNVNAPMASVPVIDGVLSPGEWDDAVKVDISDVLGYGSGSPKPRGSVFMYFKYDTQTQMLYVAGEDFLNSTLDDNEGIGLYFDDNNNGNFEPQNAAPIFQEGNFWAYWHPGGSDLRFRQIFTGGGVGNVITISNAQVDFSDASGHLQGEVAIPMGFMDGNQLQVYGPNNTVGLGAFLIERNAGNAIFDGWWPQNMHSVFIPQYFGGVKINIELPSPPQTPNNISVDKQGNSLMLSWSDPTLGLNNYPLPSAPTMNVYKNGDYFSSFNQGVESFLDDSVLCGRWYQYAMNAYIIQNSDTMVSPISSPVGNFACFDPALTPISYDDSTYELFYIVNSTFDNNKFAVRFTPTFYPSRVVKLSTTVNSSASFDFTIKNDSSGMPGSKTLAGPYTVKSNGNNVSTINFTLPGNDPPWLRSGDFWVVVNYLPESPAAPGIGVDTDPPNSGRGMFYTRTDGWQSFTAGNLMITAYIADTTTVNDIKQLTNKIPKTYDLMQNYPNPFNPSTVISYQLPESQTVTLDIFNELGQKVSTLVNETQNAGLHNVTWNGKNDFGNSVSSGIYFYRIKAGNFVNVKKMILLK